MKVLVTGGYGFLGDAVTLELVKRGHDTYRSHHNEYDLVNFVDAIDLINDQQPEVVVHLAANVGGIEKNVRKPGELFYDNMRMGLNLMEAIRRYNENTNVVLIGTACSYPDNPPIPTPESALWTGGRPAEDTRPYGVAKLALFEMGAAYQRQWKGLRVSCIIPTNLYGPDDNFDGHSGHVIPALMTRFAALKDAGGPPVKIFGTGHATRDFLYITDAARGIADAVEKVPGPEPINLGSGREITIRYVAELLGQAFEVPYEFTSDGPVGTNRRLLDITRARDVLGWKPKVRFEDGLWYTIKRYRRAL